MGTVTGKDATIAIWSGSTPIASKDQSLWGYSDFSLGFSRGTVEQELVGQTGNWHGYGALSAEGSYTNCKFGASGNADSVQSITKSNMITVSGTTGSNLSWYLISCQITSFGVNMGDADTITEASVDFVVLDPYNIKIDNTSGHITNDQKS